MTWVCRAHQLAAYCDTVILLTYPLIDVGLLTTEHVTPYFLERTARLLIARYLLIHAYQDELPVN